MNLKNKHLTIKEILDYEVNSNILAPYISSSWAQDLLVSYIAWKVRRKHRRYAYKKMEKINLENKLNELFN